MKNLMMIFLFVVTAVSAGETTVLKSELTLETWEGFDHSSLGFKGEIAQKLYLGMDVPVHRDPTMTCMGHILLSKMGKSLTCYKCSETESDVNADNFRCFAKVDIKTGKLN